MSRAIHTAVLAGVQVAALHHWQKNSQSLLANKWIMKKYINSIILLGCCKQQTGRFVLWCATFHHVYCCDLNSKLHIMYRSFHGCLSAPSGSNFLAIWWQISSSLRIGFI